MSVPHSPPVRRHRSLIAWVALIAIVLSVIMLVLVLSAMITVGAARASTSEPTVDATPPGLAIFLDDEVAEVTDGASVTYHLRLVNGDIGELVEGTLRLLVPEFATVTDPGNGVVDDDGVIAWDVRFEPGSEVERTIAITLGTIPDGLVRVVTRADLLIGDSTLPVVATADSDRITGVVDPAGTVTTGGTRVRWPIVAAASGVVLLTGFALIAVRRRACRRRRVGASTPLPDPTVADRRHNLPRPAVANRRGGDHD